MFPVEETSVVTECIPSRPKNGAQFQRHFLRLFRFIPSHFSRYQFYLPFFDVNSMSIPAKNSIPIPLTETGKEKTCLLA